MNCSKPAIDAQQDLWNALDVAGDALDRAFEAWRTERSQATRRALADAAASWGVHLERVIGKEAAARYLAAISLALDCEERAQHLAGAMTGHRELTLGDRRLMRRVWAEERTAMRQYEDVEASTYAALARERSIRCDCQSDASYSL